MGTVLDWQLCNLMPGRPRAHFGWFAPACGRRLCKLIGVGAVPIGNFSCRYHRCIRFPLQGLPLCW
eukprot:1064643-Prorocentrum_lima.AAC.1